MEFVEAGREHRRLLIDFECVEGKPPPRAKQHPEHWAWDVQAWLRNNARPPRKHPHYLTLALDDDEVAGAAAYQWRGEGYFEFSFAAVSLSHQGSGLADELLADTLDKMAALTDEQGFDRVVVEGEVFHQNIPCQRWLGRNGFAVVDASDEFVHTWGMTFAVDV